VGDTVRDNSRKNDKQKRQHPVCGGWRFRKGFDSASEPAMIVPVQKQMETDKRSGFF